MKKIFKTLLPILFSAFFLLSGGCGVGEGGKDKNPQSGYVHKRLENESAYYKAFYVSPVGNDEGTGAYNSPFKTVERAKEEVRRYTSEMTADIAVVLRGGEYYQYQTLKFTAEDNGKNGFDVVYMGYPNETASIRGGVKLSNWKQAESRQGAYYTEVSAKYIRNLWSNGRRATLAREPDGVEYAALTEWDEQGKRLVGDFDYIQGAKDFEAVLYLEWSESIARVKSVEQKGEYEIPVLNESDRDLLFSSFKKLPQVRETMPLFFQNAVEFLDEPGEFCYEPDEGRLYYYPREGEDMSKAEIIAGNLDSIVKIGDGDVNGKIVKNIRFDGLTFEYSTETLAEKHGFMEVQTGVYKITKNVTDVVGGAIELRKAQYIDFSDCTIRHTGGGGLLFYIMDYDCEVDGNVFTDTGAYAVMVAPGIANAIYGNLYPTGGTPQSYICRDISVTNNYTYHTSVEYKRSAALVSCHGYNITFEHNEVAYTGYTGISVGWGWSLNEYYCRNNRIVANDIHHYGLYGSDLGGIYTLNNQPGTVVENNYIHENQSNLTGYSAYSPAEGIYLDEGSNNMSVRNNQIAHAGLNGRMINYHVTGENIVDEGNRTDHHGGTLDEEIIAAAGPLEKYRKNAPYGSEADGAGAVVYTASGRSRSNGTEKWYGYKIRPTADGVVYGLGRFALFGNDQCHRLQILDADGNQIAVCTVDMQSAKPSRTGYVYARFNQAVKLEKGKQYFLLSEEFEDGDAYLHENTKITMNGFTVMGMAQGTEKIQYIGNTGYGYVGIDVLLQ